MNKRFCVFKGLIAAVMSAVLVVPVSLPVMAADLDSLNDMVGETANVSDILEVSNDDITDIGSQDVVLDGADASKPAFTEENIVIERDDNTDIYYDGKEHRPGYKLYDIRDNKKVLLDGSEYDVVYEENKDPGWALVTFSSKDKTFAGGKMYDFFEIKYSLDPLKAANTTDSMKSVSGNILIKNTDENFGIYAAVIEKDSFDEIKKNESLINGTFIEKETNKALSTGYAWNNGSVRRMTLAPGKQYRVFISLFEAMYFEADDDCYTDLGTVEVSQSITNDYSDYKNGDEINLKAMFLKTQDVKVTWAPDKRSYPDYYTFELYAIDADGNESSRLWPAPAYTKRVGGKGCAIKAADAAPVKSGLVLLKCFDREGNLKGKYLAAVAPFLYEVQGGDKNEERSFTFSEYTESGNLSFRLQAGLANKEDYYKPELSCSVPSEGLTRITTPLSAKLNVPSLQASYYLDGSALEKDGKYCFRVKSEYNYKGLILTSMASNVLAAKVGPGKCEILYITGEDPSELINTGDDYAFAGIHADSDSTCLKKGYIIFSSPIDPTDASVTGRIELFRSNEKCGIYKGIRAYKPANVMKLGSYGFYYVEYNNFPPEERWFYRIRVISGKGSPGGFGEGYENTTKFEKVQDLYVMDTGSNSLELSWKHDDCAKQYWIYCIENTPENPINIEEEFKKASLKKPKYAVNGGAYKKLALDNKNTYLYHTITDKYVNNTKEYYYMVRPVYNPKVKPDYDDYSYAVSIYTDPDGKGVKPTAAEMKPKAVKADTYSMLQPVIRWSAVPSDKINKVIGYRIQRVLSSKYEAALTDPSLWTTIDIYYDSPDKTIKTAFSKRAYLDTSIDKVGTYVYRVCGLYDKNVPLEGTDGKTDYTETKFDTVPLPVYGLGVAKQTGNDYRYGARIKFGIDKKDIELLKIPGIELTYTVETSDNGVDYTIFKTGKVDPNVQVYQFTDDNGGFELKRGVKRRYKVTITNGGIDEKGVPFNSMRGISYQKPTEIYLEDVPDTLVAGSGTRTIKISYNGTVCELDGEPETSDSSVLSIDSWDNDYVTVKPKKAGKAKITVKAYRYGWGGVTRTVTIEVKPQEKKK